MRRYGFRVSPTSKKTDGACGSNARPLDREMLRPELPIRAPLMGIRALLLATWGGALICPGMAAVLRFTDRGIHCPAGDFYIDPWRPVPRAVITHAHSDHARSGHGAYLATPETCAVMRHRLGQIRAEAAAFGMRRRIGGATVSLHPAGHVPGSAQVRVEVGGEVWVVSGDYKTARDRVSAPFEPVSCHAFISECTFGLPIFRWTPEAAVMADVNAWWAANRAAGRVSILGAYSFGKAQRLIAGVDSAIGPILTHGAVEETNRILRAGGLALPETIHAGPGVTGKTHPGALVIAPPAALGSAWAGRFGPADSGFASGWMTLRGHRRRRGVARGFAISDHADWDGLNAAIAATGAERVFVTHGYTESFRRWLASQGYDAGIVTTGYGGEDDEADLPGAEDAAEGNALIAAETDNLAGGNDAGRAEDVEAAENIPETDDLSRDATP